MEMYDAKPVLRCRFNEDYTIYRFFADVLAVNGPDVIERKLGR